jgi:hypothetical protein
MELQPTTTEKPNKGGAPKQNLNALRHGLRADLSIGGLAKRYAWIRRTTGSLRRNLEQLATEVHGSLNPLHIATINRATRLELMALLAMRALRELDKDLSLQERLALWDRVTNATEARDKALAKLGLDKASVDSDASWPDPEADEWQESPEGVYETRSTSSSVTRCADGGAPVSPHGSSGLDRQARRSDGPSGPGVEPAATGEHNAEGGA